MSRRSTCRQGVRHAVPNGTLRKRPRPRCAVRKRLGRRDGGTGRACQERPLAPAVGSGSPGPLGADSPQARADLPPLTGQRHGGRSRDGPGSGGSTRWWTSHRPDGRSTVGKLQHTLVGEPQALVEGGAALAACLDIGRKPLSVTAFERGLHEGATEPSSPQTGPDPDPSDVVVRLGQVTLGHRPLHVEHPFELESVGPEEPQGRAAIDGLRHLPPVWWQGEARTDQTSAAVVCRAHLTTVGKDVDLQVEGKHQFPTCSAPSPLRQHPLRHRLALERLREGGAHRRHLSPIGLPHGRHVDDLSSAARQQAPVGVASSMVWFPSRPRCSDGCTLIAM